MPKIKNVFKWVNGVQKQIYPEVVNPTTIVCDFKADGTGTTSLNDIMVLGDFVGQRSGNTSISAGNNGSLRLSIPATDYAANISLGGGDAWGTAITNLGYSNGCANSSRLRQNLVKKSYLKISALYDSGYGASGAYPIFNRGGVCVGFNKKKVSSNWYTGTSCAAGFVFPRGDYSNWSNYIVYPIDANTQYLALPTTENLGENHTATGYVDQGTSCLYSRLTLETRGRDPSDFHYWLIVGATGNEYDLGLCSSLGSCNMYVNSGDWWKNGSYKEIEEAYIEYFDNYYIDEDGNITTTKPR